MLKLYDKYLEPDDLVGYYGLGDGWIFDVQLKGADAAGLREQIVGSVEKAGDPHVYSSIETCVGCLATQVDRTLTPTLTLTVTLTLTPTLTLTLTLTPSP